MWFKLWFQKWRSSGMRTNWAHTIGNTIDSSGSSTLYVLLVRTTEHACSLWFKKLPSMVLSTNEQNAWPRGNQQARSNHREKCPTYIGRNNLLQSPLQCVHPISWSQSWWSPHSTGKEKIKTFWAGLHHKTKIDLVQKETDFFCTCTKLKSILSFKLSSKCRRHMNICQGQTANRWQHNARWILSFQLSRSLTWFR